MSEQKDGNKGENTDKIAQLRIISEDDKSIFDANVIYEIPLYQRGYAWKEKQLTQLWEDIQDVEDKMNYYIGSLVVSKQDDVYEVVDGQQRLTSLFLLLNCLGIETGKSLRFACRERANQTLEHVNDLISDENSRLEREQLDSDILEGIQILKQKIKVLQKQKDFAGDLEKIRNYFVAKLKRVILYRIELPAHMDLNRYFEIMNTRGEQLEQHDIVKAKLMKSLSGEEGSMFSQIWDACRDMTGYVQMHFPASFRTLLFGEKWGACPDKAWMDYHEEWRRARSCEKDLTKNSIAANAGTAGEKEGVPADEGEGKTMRDCLEDNFGRLPKDSDEDNGEKERIVYESIVEFPVFLLHVLKIYVAKREFEVKLPQELDDKKLIKCFDLVMEKGSTQADLSKDFILFLLKMRFLFDAFVIKREYKYTYEKPDSEWSLKKLKSYGSDKNQSADYVNSFGDSQNASDRSQKRLIMIQSCFRVAYTSPKSMHWLTEILKYLSQQEPASIQGEGYADKIEDMAQKEVKDLLKDEVKDQLSDEKIYQGVGMPNIVFHYLDYLLWKADWEKGQSKYKDFVFEFRDSVEHFYPQNPSDGSFDKWEETVSINGRELREVDQFGNLALLTSGQNSRLSNQDPAYKVTKLKDAITRGSIKLRIMSEILETLTKSEGITNACKKWKESECQKHGEEMLQILREAVGF